MVSLFFVFLEKCYIADNFPAETASRMATKAGIKALALGIRNQETRLILKTGIFNNLASAVGKATENECNSSAILNFTRNTTNNNKRNNERNSNQNWRSRGRYRNQYNHQRNNYRGGNNSRGGHQQFNNSRGGYQPPNITRGGYRERIYRNSNHQPQNRVYYAENPEPPQHLIRQNAGGENQNQRRPQIQLSNVQQNNVSH